MKSLILWDVGLALTFSYRNTDTKDAPNSIPEAVSADAYRYRLERTATKEFAADGRPPRKSHAASDRVILRTALCRGGCLATFRPLGSRLHHRLSRAFAMPLTTIISAPTIVSVVGISLNRKKPKRAAHTRIVYSIGATVETSANLNASVNT